MKLPDRLLTSYATANVTGESQVGGLAGSNDASGNIVQSYATGVTRGGLHVGGLVGINRGSITQCYATGDVNPAGRPAIGAGGLAGLNLGTIMQAYSTGLAGGGGGFGLGGLVGIGGGTVVSSYWDTQTSGRTTSAEGTGLTTAELKAALPSGFDPAVWGIIPTVTYPYLLWQTALVPPAAANIAKTTAANTPVPIDLSEGASGNPTSAAIVTGPANGSLGAITGTTVTYTPNPCYVGTDSFTFMLSNSFGTSNTATATITVTGPPTAANQTTATNFNTPKQINLTAGACGSPASAALVGTPVGGTVSGFPATTVTFTPTTGFSGTASFQFTLANAFGRSNTATATITVSRPPILSVTPTYRPVGAAAGAASFSVRNTGGGTMTYAASVTSGSSWLRITSGQSGGNGGTINVSYAANSGALLSGTIQVVASGAIGSPVTITITQAAGSAAAAIAVHLVDPFLLGANLSSIDLSQLYSAKNWAAVEAKGLVADGVSAAIAVVQTNDCASNIALTTTNGTKLLIWNPGFLTTAPVATAGVPSFTITAEYLTRPIGGFCFAAVLVQGPIGGPPPSFTARIFVTARQGSQTSKVQAELVPPPVVLVHGIWGDRTSLGGSDGAGASASLARYLKTTAPWSSRPDLVSIVCYSKYYVAFNARTDPIAAASADPCEQTQEMR